MKRIAVIVGVNSYRAPITSLKCAERDAIDMYALFSRLPGYADVSAFTGTTATRADDVRRGIEDRLRTVGPGDLAVLYFAGHGTMSPKGEQLLLFPDADVDNLDYYAGAIALEQVKKAVRRRGCNCLIVLDACRNSLCDNTRAALPDGRAGLRDLTVSTTGPKGAAPGVVPDLAIYYGCQEGKCSAERGEHGLFTGALMKVMEEALKEKREVRFDEAFRRAVFGKMELLGKGAVGSDQRPTPYGDLSVPLLEGQSVPPPPPIPVVPKRSPGKIATIAALLALLVGGGLVYKYQADMKEAARVAKRLADALTLVEVNDPSPGEVREFELPGGVKMKFCWCPATTSGQWKEISGEKDFFLMGSPPGEEGRYGDEAQHRVTLTKGFWLGQYEVTQAQWRAVMRNKPSDHKGDGNLPVEMVLWEDCTNFIAKCNAAAKGVRFALPTEAQWEYACRAGSTGPYAGTGNLDEMGWYSGDETHPVGRKRPNAWNLYDMHGNVFEWCADWYGDYEGDCTDPTGPASGEYRVLRGGCWGNFARYCRSAYRYWNWPGYRRHYYGFRLLCSAGPHE